MLSYAIVPGDPEGSGTPVTVTIASEQGWSLVGVLGSETSAPDELVALVGARGLDAALRPLAPGTTGMSRLEWHGERRPTGAIRTSRRRTAQKGASR